MEETMILAERDLKLNKTMMEMRNEQVRLLTRMKQVGGRKRKNKYLNDVYEIYKNYRDDILVEKKSQEKQIKNLIKYLEKMRISQNNINENILKKIDKEEKDLKKKLSDLKEEIKTIKRETKSRKK
tara:strand:- start:730 stop:1107 length:378 start_codon:yes stop_codon:yes gene_type:complete